MTKDYGPVFGELLDVDRLRALDEGSPDGANRSRLESLLSVDGALDGAVEGAFAHAQVTDADGARCCLSAIWLLYDFLDESHTISQGIATVDGSFWHGIMHRREGDFSNAKYWFRKVGEHPVFELLGDKESGDWNPYDFVDACQSALRTGGSEADRCQLLQQREWELLFEHCYQQTIGE